MTYFSCPFCRLCFLQPYHSLCLVRLIIVYGVVVFCEAQISSVTYVFYCKLFRELLESETKVSQLEQMVANFSKESQDKRELLESIQSDKETISK